MGVDYDGGPNSVSISRLSVTDARRKYYALYFQDDWKVTPRLTLNLGLRWEYFPSIYDAHDAQSNFIQGTPFATAAYLIPQSRSDQGDPNNALSPSFLSLLQKDGVKLQYAGNRGLRDAQWGNFAPRFGFAYKLTGRTVVRGGYGISYNGLEGVGYGPALGATYPFAFTSGFSNSSNQSPIIFSNSQPATLENAYANNIELRMREKQGIAGSTLGESSRVGQFWLRVGSKKLAWLPTNVSNFAEKSIASPERRIASTVQLAFGLRKTERSSCSMRYSDGAVVIRAASAFIASSVSGSGITAIREGPCQRNSRPLAGNRSAIAAP